MNPQVMEHKWVEHVRAWQASGLTQKAYAQAHGLRAASLSYWVGRGRAASVKQAKFVLATVALAADGEHHPCTGQHGRLARSQPRRVT